MATNTIPPQTARGSMPTGETFRRILAARQFRGAIWRRFFALAIIIALLALVALVFNIVNDSFGSVAVQVRVNPATLSSTPLEDLNSQELFAILSQYQSRRLLVYVRDRLSRVDASVFTTTPIRQALAGSVFPPEVAELTVRDLTPEQTQQLFLDNFTTDQLYELVITDVVGQEVLKAYSLVDTLFNRSAIEAEIAERYPDAQLVGRSWLNTNFLTVPMSRTPAIAGIRTAILGTLWVVSLTILFAFPIGVAAAIYLEEYATHGRLSQLIEINIRNLSGVPSIIYGLLGLAIFVRTLEAITQGRTIISAALTMALLVLPVVIINAQEAIRAVPSSIREASYGLGATKWQTVWNQVLPAALPGILTGTILALSRAIGETAPLILIGGLTFLQIDPSGPTSRFTALPIQIYNWAQDSNQQFRNAAAATIVVLLVILLSFNATAIILRQRFRKKLQS